MATTTVRIPEDKRDMQMILSELIDEYLERNKETLEILSNPQWVDTIQEGLMAAGKGETIRWRDKQSGHVKRGQSWEKELAYGRH